MIGITGYGAYIPRLRLSRKAVFQANAWFAPQLAARAKGSRSMANWDEDCITMAVAAARDCLGADEDRSHIRGLYLASCTLPYVDRLNAGIVSEALTLDDSVDALDIVGSQRVGLSALMTGLTKVQTAEGQWLILSADMRKARAASAQELDFGDGAAAITVGSERVIAEFLGGGTVCVDFVDHFRSAGEEVDYQWEERWVRDEGIGKLMPRAVAQALKAADISSDQIDHFIFPSSIAKVDAQLAKSSGIKPSALVDTLSGIVGDIGTPHALLLLAHVLERASPGQIILVSQVWQWCAGPVVSGNGCNRGLSPAPRSFHLVAAGCGGNELHQVPRIQTANRTGSRHARRAGQKNGIDDPLPAQERDHGLGRRPLRNPRAMSIIHRAGFLTRLGHRRWIRKRRTSWQIAWPRC